MLIEAGKVQALVGRLTPRSHTPEESCGQKEQCIHVLTYSGLGNDSSELPRYLGVFQVPRQNI